MAAELTARVGARVMGEHRHPALVERFTVLAGEFAVKIDGKTSILRQGESAVIEANAWLRHFVQNRYSVAKNFL